MFIHQVIEDLKRTEYVNKKTQFFTNKVKNAVCFHMGDIEKLYTLMEVDKKFNAKEMFDGAMGKDIRPPFPITWVDFIAPYTIPSKFGILAVDITQRKNEQLEFIVGCFAEDKKKWALGPIAYYVSPCVPHQIQHNYVRQTKPMCWHPIFMEDMDEFFAGWQIDEAQSFYRINNKILGVFNILLLLVCCKNITTETIFPPAKLNRKRKKKGKQPIFSYKTLIIKPTGKKQESIPKHLWDNRIHLARGHFKTYTKENPLFGKITGRFWWQPHVRGRNHEGVVMKDYKIEAG